MTAAQNTFYWRLWSGVRKREPEADRKAMHAQLGLPESHTCWNNGHFDKWKGACLAITQPGNADAQLAQLRMAATRHRVFIGHVLDAMGEGPALVEQIVSMMNRGGKLGGRCVTYETLGDAHLEKVIVAVKKEAKRRWRTKEVLLQAVCSALFGLDADAVDAALCAALNCHRVSPLEVTMKMARYEDLLVMLGTLRRLALCEEHDAAEPATMPRFEVRETEDIPF